MAIVKQCLLALAVTTAALSRTASADPLKVAVVPGIAVNLDAARVDALSQELASALEAELVVDAVGGLEVRRQLPADGIPPDCIATPSCVADVAKRVGAQQLLFVVMVDTGTGGAIQIDTTWIDPGSGQNAARPAIDIASLSDARARFLDAAKLLLPDAPVRPKPKTGGPIGTMSPAVPRHFTTPAKITAGVSAVGLGLGIAMGLRTRSKYNSCDDRGFACTDDERDAIRTSGIFADAGYAIGIGGAIATVVLFVTSAKEPHLVVTPTESGGAVTFLGSF